MGLVVNLTRVVSLTSWEQNFEWNGLRREWQMMNFRQQIWITLLGDFWEEKQKNGTEA